MNKKVISTRTIRPYDLLFSISYYSLKQAKNEEYGSFHNCIIAMVFCAFSIEAFINHIGMKNISNWDEIEKKLNYQEKLELFLRTKNTTIDKSKKPFCYLNTIFDYRKNIVHAKTENIKEEKYIQPDCQPAEPLTKWERMTTVEQAIKFLNHTKEIIVSLNKLINNDEKIFTSPYEWSFIREL